MSRNFTPNWVQRRRKTRIQVAENSFFQWNMIRSLAFGERDWILLFSLMCALSTGRDFWTVSGLLCFTVGIFLLGPVFGVFIHLITVFLYKRGKARDTLPEDLEKLTWYANAICAPVILLFSWLLFDMFFDSVDDILGLVAGKGG